MIPIKINNQKLEVPTRWEDVTFKQYLQYTELKSHQLIDAVALFTGIDRKRWENSKEIENFYIIVGALDFLMKEPNVKGVQNPGAVKIGDKNYIVPQGLEHYTVKQFEDFRGLVRREQKDGKEITIRIYPKLISIYFCNLIFGTYTVKNIEKTVPLIEGLPLYDVIGIGNFFFKSSTELLNGMKKERRLLRMIGKKLMQVFR